MTVNIRKVRIVTQNVQSVPLMSLTQVRQDIARAKRQGDIIGWQEIGPEWMKRELMKMADNQAWETFMPREGEAYESPITWRKKLFVMEKGGAVTLLPGNKYTAERTLTWVLLRHRKSGKRILVHNFHYLVSWNKERDEWPRRVQLWKETQEEHVDWVRKMITHHPDALSVGLGDYNRHRARDGDPMPRNIKGMKVQYGVGEQTIDYIWYLNPVDDECWWVEKSQNVFEAHSDHDGRRVVLSVHS